MKCCAVCGSSVMRPEHFLESPSEIKEIGGPERLVLCRTCHRMGHPPQLRGFVAAKQRLGIPRLLLTWENAFEGVGVV